MDEQDIERQVRVLPTPRLDLGLDGDQRFLGRIDVDVMFVGASLAVTLDAPAEEIEAIVFSELIYRRCRRWSGGADAAGDVGESGHPEFNIPGLTLRCHVELS
jgi:hypothetical protein